MYIAVIVPIHNGLSHTKLFLKSFLKSSSQYSDKLELIIVDDGSTDLSNKWISKNYPSIKVLQGDGKLWWSGAVNMGLRYALNKHYTHFLLFNNDNIVTTNYFKNLFSLSKEITKSYILASRVIDLFPSKNIRYCGEKFDIRTGKFIKNSNQNSTFICNSAGGMGVLISKEQIARVGLLNAKLFPQYYGDTDFLLRASKFNYQVMYEPKLTIFNNNLNTGYALPKKITDIKNAYSYPKGKLNLTVDYKFYSIYTNRLIAVHKILIKNIKYIFRCIFILLKKD